MAGSESKKDVDQRQRVETSAPSEARPAQVASTLIRRGQLATLGYKYGLIGVWAVMIMIYSALLPDTFPTTAIFSTLFGSQAVLVILSLALLIPITAGEFDLSIAGTLGLGLILTQYLTAEQGWVLGAAILVALLAGVLVGLVNAFFIIVIGVQSIIVTLGIGTLLLGVAFGITPATVVGTSDVLDVVVRDRLFDIPRAFYYGLALTIIIWYVYARTPLGRYLYFVGAGRDVARLSGIRVELIRTGALVASGVLAATAGIVLAGVLSSSAPGVAPSFLLPAFAAVFLGATCVTPGRFNPWGTFIAVYFLITGITGLELLGLIGWVEQVFYGAALVVAVALSELAGKRRVEAQS